MVISYKEVIEEINSMKREIDGIYNSPIDHLIAADKVEAVNDAIDEVIDYIKGLSFQNMLIMNHDIGSSNHFDGEDYSV